MPKLQTIFGQHSVFRSKNKLKYTTYFNNRIPFSPPTFASHLQVILQVTNHLFGNDRMHNQD